MKRRRLYQKSSATAEKSAREAAPWHGPRDGRRPLRRLMSEGPVAPGARPPALDLTRRRPTHAPHFPRAESTLHLVLRLRGGGHKSNPWKKAHSKMRWKWKKKRTRRLQKKRRKMRQRSK